MPPLTLDHQTYGPDRVAGLLADPGDVDGSYAAGTRYCYCLAAPV
ncbi:hypothetical protein ACLB1S_14825 [Escherichia coli]